jgi:hypothetical protein
MASVARLKEGAMGRLTVLISGARPTEAFG